MVLKNKVIVILSNIRIDGPIQASSLFLARELAKENKVFFVDYPLTLKDYFNKENAGQVAYRKGKFARSSDGVIDTDLPNLKYVITPPVIPVNFLPEGFIFNTFRKINENIVAKRLIKVLRNIDRKDLIYINSFNFHFPGIAQKIKPALNVYHCVDPMIVDYDKKHGPKAEAKLVGEADVVVCTSEELYREKKPFNANTYLVPNGANAAHYTKALSADYPVHSKLKNIPKPIIGYLGTIERRIDYPLVEEVVKANPDKSFVFAGPVWSQEQIVALQSLPNVYFIGAVTYEETPQIIKGYDVTIIPFQVDKVSSTIFPLKLFEYLSVGKPVVTTNFNPDLKPYTKDAVAYCNDADSFTRAINEILSTDTAEKATYRVTIAQENTWEKRGEQIAGILEKHLK